jgi:hypothetical protein
MEVSVYPPTTVTHLLINTLSSSRIVYLPAISTMGPGKLYSIKDICGNAGRSSIFLSTTGLDSFEYKFRPSTLYALMSTNFQSVLLASDGTLNWMILQNYTANAIARAVTFLPTQVTGLQFWYDANDQSTMTFSGSTVTQWRDKSGNSRNLNQNTGATFATNSLVFTGGQSYNAANSGNLLRNTFFSIFVVERVNTGGFLFGDTVAGRTGGSLHVGYRSLTNATMAFWATDLELTTISGSGVSRIWSFILPGSGNRFVNLNGSLLGTFTNNTQLTSFDTLQVGAVFGGSLYNGSIFELVGYTGSLTTLQNQQVEGYLAWKWGLQANLPSGHPYKNSPP